MITILASHFQNQEHNTYDFTKYVEQHNKTGFFSDKNEPFYVSHHQI